MKKYPTLNFPLRKPPTPPKDGATKVLHTRRGWLELTPEEWVRRHVVLLLEERGVESQRIIEEYPVRLNRQAQRADIVVVNRQGEALLLVECKAPEVELSQQTLNQVVRYNSVLKANYVMLTNGLQHFLYAYKDGAYEPQRFEELNLNP